jgi:hypothetical protein
MPWTVSDVDSHKKGLSPSQKKSWVKVANSIYKDCMTKGGTDKTCAPKAIRIANSKFSEVVMKKTETVKLRRDAFCFTDKDTFAKVESVSESAGKTLKMTAYSGKIIKDHWYWGDLAIDTSGLKMAKKAIPVLNDHNTDKKIGFGNFVVNDKHEVVAGEEATFVDTPFAEEFIRLSGQGFPYEASIYARPTKIQRLMEKEEAEVNGYTMKGPGTVWRESVLKECSVVTFGADANTKSAAMAEDEEVAMEVEMLQFTENEKEVDMDLEKLKAEFPELYAQVIALGKTEAETAFTAEKDQLEKQISDLTAERDQLSASNKDVSERLLRLEKTDALRQEQEIKATADALFEARFGACSIPKRLYLKVRKQISHDSFIKDGKLDKTAFTAAVEAELKDWAVPEGEEEDLVLGMGFSKRETETPLSEEAIVTRMLAHTGQKAVAH